MLPASFQRTSIAHRRRAVFRQTLLCEAPSGLDQLAHLFDARLPDTEHVLVRPLVDAAERAVADQIAQPVRADDAVRDLVEHGLLLVRELDALEPRPREVLHPRSVRALPDALDGRPCLRPDPPVVKDRLRIGVICRPLTCERLRRRVAAVPVYEQEASKSLRVERIEKIANDC